MAQSIVFFSSSSENPLNKEYSRVIEFLVKCAGFGSDDTGVEVVL